MQKQVVRVYGVLIGLLAVIGFFAPNGTYMFGGMNADTALDWGRLVLAVFLLYVGFTSSEAMLVRAALWITGAVYVALGIVALFDNTLWGLLPTGLTGFDVGFHVVTGLLAIAIGAVGYNDNDVVKA